jgi:predicted Rossmann fold nucleotide-binding protein DprA/Smf involved in DNA uptake
VNHFQRNRECAINFEILRRLVQDDTLLMQRVTRESYPELLQVSAFYHSHFPTLRFVHDFPGVFQMMQRETVAAFAKLLPNTKVISKFDEEYPASLLLDLKDEAPLFLYASGNIALLQRHYAKIVIAGSRSANEKEMIHARAICEQLGKADYVVASGFDDPLDTCVQSAAQEAGFPTIAFLHIPLVKSFVDGSLSASIKRNLFHSPSLAISPFPPTQNGMLKSESALIGKMLASIGKVSIVMSAKDGGSAQREAGYCVQMHKPVILPKYILLSLKFNESKYILSVNSDEELMDLVKQFV